MGGLPATVGSQSVKGAEVGGDRGYDGGKNVTGREWRPVVDSPGLPWLD